MRGIIPYIGTLNNSVLPWLITLLAFLLLLILNLTIKTHPSNSSLRNQTWNITPFETPNQQSPPTLCVSYADAPVIGSQRALKRHRWKEHRHLQSMQTEIYADNLTTLSSASATTSITLDVFANETTPNNIYVPSAGMPSTVPYPNPASNLPDKDHFLVHTLEPEASCPSIPRHIYFDNLQAQSSPYDLDPEYSLVKMPYSPEGFNHLLELTNLMHQFPKLTWKLRHGFPIGNMNPLTSTYTPQNLPGADIYHSICDEYIADELAKGCFSGPYTHDQLYMKIGHFHLSPLQVVVKKGIQGTPDKHCVCRHLSYHGSMSSSINNEIDASKFPTEWGTTDEFADIVHHFSDMLSYTSLDALCEHEQYSCSLIQRHKASLHIHLSPYSCNSILSPGMRRPGRRTVCHLGYWSHLLRHTMPSCTQMLSDCLPWW